MTGRHVQWVDTPVTTDAMIRHDEASPAPRTGPVCIFRARSTTHPAWRP